MAHLGNLAAAGIPQADLRVEEHQTQAVVLQNPEAVLQEAADLLCLQILAVALLQGIRPVVIQSLLVEVALRHPQQVRPIQQVTLAPPVSKSPLQPATHSAHLPARTVPVLHSGQTAAALRHYS